MNPEVHHPHIESEEDNVNLIEQALSDAGLYGIKAPKAGSLSYQRLLDAANGYMNEVKKVEVVTPESTKSGYDDREDYYKPTRPSTLTKISSSDTSRREYHDKLGMMLFGKQRKGMPKAEANQLSNFAAYLTGNEDYVDTWGD